MIDDKNKLTNRTPVDIFNTVLEKYTEKNIPMAKTKF
jgi:hypothetical protein